MKQKTVKLLLLILFLMHIIDQSGFAHFKTTSDSPIHITSDGKLEYKLNENGDRVPDFSYCGFNASESSIPNVPVKVIVPPSEHDATVLIQSAIDYVSDLPIDENGFRGTVLLEKGTYRIEGSLKIRTSGVVLRGSGSQEDGTTLLGAGVGRETLIQVAGIDNKQGLDTTELANRYFPVNTSELSFEDGHSFKVGDHVVVNRPSTQKWIESIGADKIGIYVDYPLTNWDVGDFDFNWDRTVVAVTSTSIQLDAPLTNSIDPQFGGGKVIKYKWEGRISHVGIENLRCVSAFDESNKKDENHRWMAITMESIQDGWVRRVVAENFVSSAVAIWETAGRITVEDCKSLSPVGEIGNYRRYAFQTLGQQILFQRCYAEYAYHAFSVGFTTPGPNAFVQCYSYLPYNFSGAVGGWSSGILFDKMTIDGGNINFAFRDVDGQGGGWSAANSLCWQCRAAQIHLDTPPQAQNWAFASWAQGYGSGHHELQHTFVKPESIYYAQLEARTGKKSEEEQKILVYDSGETTAPGPELSARNSERSKTPDLTMEGWIDQMIEEYPIQNDVSTAKPWTQSRSEEWDDSDKSVIPASITNGWITIAGEVATGGRDRTSLWRGSTRPSYVKKAIPNLTRFVPGRYGRGLTDQIDTLVMDMQRAGTLVLMHYPSLWYERRRDDHARTRRADADVWAPFFEQPFSRSGVGEAFDRLSKYDLDKWNPWYWMRLKRFADLADQNGLLFIQEHYLQHNIIEEGAHWVDYPWRSANNINELGFAENPHYAGDKRVYMAEEFYDTTHVVRKKYHKQYIRKSLDEFKDNTNVIHHLGLEYTGPLHFVEFWLDVIAEWENENSQDVLVMLPGTKDVQDAILADSKRSKIVDIVDVIQWQYRDDGSLYAPMGGVSLAPRQYLRIMDVGETSFDQIYRAVSEFRRLYPSKAMVYSRRHNKLENWAVFMGGGSLETLPVTDDSLLQNAIEMSPLANKKDDVAQYALGKKGAGYIVYSKSTDLQIDLTHDSTTYLVNWVNPLTGELLKSKTEITGGKIITLKAPFKGDAVCWLKIK
ncbi:DUF6298 domain-containing protein [Sunxiuqinia indica]|uniref:DUF6298 domain-containing protein n=1 Tax=Sunxiuqinia indica TaxID=2692584 RepID=UPI0019150669|nr:DUF6298 domain-containing protein [Sunxiuqinia indica]